MDALHCKHGFGILWILGWYIVQIYCNAIRVDSVGNVSENSVFYEASTVTGVFENQVMLIDVQYCGPSECYNPYPAWVHHNPSCRPCSCDDFCFMFFDCCPYVSWFMDIGIQSDVQCLQPGKRPSQDGKRYYIKSTCFDTSSADIVYNCEENESIEPDIEIPVFGGDRDRISYRNKYCAMCNGAVYTHPFMAFVRCRQSSDVLSNSSSHLVVFNAAMETADCTVDYIDESARMCYKSDTENITLIQTCNVTGIWQVYDSDVERGCQFNGYRIPVFDIYYNLFCYLCNTDETWSMIRYNMEYGAVLNGNIPQPQAFLYDVFNSLEVDDQCYILDKSGQCRKLFCANPRKYVPLYGLCENTIATNVFGYDLCLTVESNINDPSVAASEMLSTVLGLETQFKNKELFSKLIEMNDFEVWACVGETVYRQQVRFELFVTKPSGTSYLESVIYKISHDFNTKPPDKCGQTHSYSDEEASCTITVLPNSGSRQKLREEDPAQSLAKYVIYQPFSMLLSCCQIIIDLNEYSLDKYSNLYIYNSQLLLSNGDYIIYDNGSATICLEDFVMLPYETPCVDVKLYDTREPVQSLPMEGQGKVVTENTLSRPNSTTTPSLFTDPNPLAIRSCSQQHTISIFSLLMLMMFVTKFNLY